MEIQVKWIVLSERIPIQLNFLRLVRISRRERAEVFYTQQTFDKDFQQNRIKAELRYDLKKDAHSFTEIFCCVAYSRGMNNAGCAHCLFL